MELTGQTAIVTGGGRGIGKTIALLLAEKRPDKVNKIIASGVNSRMDGLTPEVLGYLKLINPDFIETNQKEWLADYKSKSLVWRWWYINSGVHNCK